MEICQVGGPLSTVHVEDGCRTLSFSRGPQKTRNGLEKQRRAANGHAFKMFPAAIVAATASAKLVFGPAMHREMRPR